VINTIEAIGYYPCKEGKTGLDFTWFTWFIPPILLYFYAINTGVKVDFRANQVRYRESGRKSAFYSDD